MSCLSPICSRIRRPRTPSSFPKKAWRSRPSLSPQLAEFARFEPGVLLVSPVHDNIQQPQVLLDHIQPWPRATDRKRRAAVILPDYCARVAVLDFDTFPTDPDEQQALVRFRLKKSVPFEVETAMVSYVQQPRIRHGGKDGSAGRGDVFRNRGAI